MNAWGCSWARRIRCLHSLCRHNWFFPRRPSACSLGYWDLKFPVAGAGIPRSHGQQSCMQGSPGPPRRSGGPSTRRARRRVSGARARTPRRKPLGCGKREKSNVRTCWQPHSGGQSGGHPDSRSTSTAPVVQKRPPSGTRDPTTGWTRLCEAADGGIGPPRRSHDPWAPRPKSRPGCVS